MPHVIFFVCLTHGSVFWKGGDLQNLIWWGAKITLKKSLIHSGSFALHLASTANLVEGYMLN